MFLSSSRCSGTFASASCNSMIRICDAMLTLLIIIGCFVCYRKNARIEPFRLSKPWFDRNLVTILQKAHAIRTLMIPIKTIGAAVKL